MTSSNRETWRTVVLALLASLVVVAVFAAATRKAPAREKYPGQYDHIDPEIRNWVKGLKDKKGNGCCDTADGYPAEYDWDMATGRYRVFIEGQWYVVPDDALLDEPNRLGYATVWWFHTWDNGKMTPKIRCFLPGAGG